MKINPKDNIGVGYFQYKEVAPKIYQWWATFYPCTYPCLPYIRFGTGVPFRRDTIIHKSFVLNQILNRRDR